MAVQEHTLPSPFEFTQHHTVFRQHVPQQVSSKHSKTLNMKRFRGLSIRSCFSFNKSKVPKRFNPEFEVVCSEDFSYPAKTENRLNDAAQDTNPQGFILASCNTYGSWASNEQVRHRMNQNERISPARRLDRVSHRMDFGSASKIHTSSSDNKRSCSKMSVSSVKSVSQRPGLKPVKDDLQKAESCHKSNKRKDSSLNSDDSATLNNCHKKHCNMDATSRDGDYDVNMSTYKSVVKVSELDKSIPELYISDVSVNDLSISRTESEMHDSASSSMYYESSGFFETLQKTRQPFRTCSVSHQFNRVYVSHSEGTVHSARESVSKDIDSNKYRHVKHTNKEKVEDSVKNHAQHVNIKQGDKGPMKSQAVNEKKKSLKKKLKQMKQYLNSGYTRRNFKTIALL